jgi:lipoyl(octanoyl) transferase
LLGAARRGGCTCAPTLRRYAGRCPPRGLALLGAARRGGRAVLTQQLGQVDYLPTWQAMQAFTAARSREMTSQIGTQPIYDGRDQLWICEHPPVFTQGLAGKSEHVLNPGDIPVVATDRGGQVTYHGPGQVVAYPLMDLKRAGYYVKEYVYRIEEAVIRTLAHFGVTGHRVMGSPGIYVRLDDPFSHARLPPSAQPSFSGRGSEELPPLPLGEGGGKGSPTSDPFRGLGKIAALGIKVSRQYSYHGVALNVAMNLEPFSRINPCGYTGLQTTDLSTIGVSVSWQEATDVLSQKLVTYLAP